MANQPKKASTDDPRCPLQVMREENNVKAAARGARFSLLLAFNRLMDRASRFKPSPDEAAGERGPRTRPRPKRILLGLGSLGAVWMTLSPRAHLYLSNVAPVAFHLLHSIIGH